MSCQVEEEWESQSSYSVGLETERAALEEQLRQESAQTEEDKPEKVPEPTVPILANVLFCVKDLTSMCSFILILEVNSNFMKYD